MITTSQERRLVRAKKYMRQLATQLNLSGLVVESAARLFNLAQRINFIQGRHTHHVSAACLYMICRQEQTSHLLIDFSDALQVKGKSSQVILCKDKFI